MIPLTQLMRDRLKQHQDNLRLWRSGAFDKTVENEYECVEDNLEKREIMNKLEGAIYELELLLAWARRIP